MVTTLCMASHFLFTKKQTQVQFSNNTPQKEQEEQFEFACLIPCPRLVLLGAKRELPGPLKFSLGKGAPAGKRQAPWPFRTLHEGPASVSRHPDWRGEMSKDS